MRHCNRKKLTVADMNRAMKWYDAQKVYGFGGAEPHQYQLVAEADVFVEEETVADIQTLAVNEQPLDLETPPVLSASWLSIEGVAVNEGSTTKANVEIPPILKQYYNATTAAIIGDSEKDLRVCQIFCRRPKLKFSCLIIYFI